MQPFPDPWMRTSPSQHYVLLSKGSSFGLFCLLVLRCTESHRRRPIAVAVSGTSSRGQGYFHTALAVLAAGLGFFLPRLVFLRFTSLRHIFSSASLLHCFWWDKRFFFLKIKDERVCWSARARQAAQFLNCPCCGKQFLDQCVIAIRCKWVLFLHAGAAQKAQAASPSPAGTVHKPPASHPATTATDKQTARAPEARKPGRGKSKKGGIKETSVGLPVTPPSAPKLQGKITPFEFIQHWNSLKQAKEIQPYVQLLEQISPDDLPGGGVIIVVLLFNTHLLCLSFQFCVGEAEKVHPFWGICINKKKTWIGFKGVSLSGVKTLVSRCLSVAVWLNICVAFGVTSTLFQGTLLMLPEIKMKKKKSS